MKARPPALAQLRFREHAGRLAALGLGEKFSHIYETNLWGSDDSRSGLGSEFEETERLRAGLAEQLKHFGIRSLLDIPCGDCRWITGMDLTGIDYTGADIVETIVNENAARYPDRTFLRLDLTRDPLPRADAVLCRDCLVHLSFENIFRAFRNLRNSGSERLIATTFLEHESNEDIADGDWRMLNLERPPFNLPRPDAVIIEGCTECGGAYADKALGFWRVAGVP